MFKKKLKETSLKDKIKSLILLSLIHAKMYKNKIFELEDVFLIKKEYLDSFYFSEINKLIIENKKIQNKLKDIKTEEISEKNIGKFIKDLDYNKFKYYDKEISKNKNEKSYEVEKEEIILSEAQKTFVYKNFCVIYKKNNIYELFKKNFGIELSESNFYFGTFNEKDVILDYKNNILFLLISNDEKIAYNIEYILVPKAQDKIFFNQLNEVVTLGYNNYFNRKMSFNKDNKNEDYISSIFLKDEIIGNCYKYNSNIKDYTHLNDYSKYLEYEALTNILSLYSYYILKKKTITSSFELPNKYYLVNSKFMNEIKNESNFSEIYKCLEKNINNIYIDEADIKKNIYFMIKNLPIDLLEKYENKKINSENNIEDIEPLQAEINYNEKEPLLIYDNFEIIDSKILDKFVKNYNNNNILVECIFNEGKIIINLPKDLSQNIFVSLIGYIKDDEFNNFVLEYILIFNDEKYRAPHIKKINAYFNDYLNSLKFDNKCYKNKEKNIIIAKYDKGNLVEKFGKEPIPNDIFKDDHNNEKNEIINKNDKIKDNFESCPHIGLDNIGATCYMNAALQCFCHIGKFVEYFKYNQQMKESIFNNKNNLSNSFKILIDELWPDNYNSSSLNNKKHYAPKDFKNKISKMNTLFEGIAANDAKDLVNFLIMTLHSELNKTIEKNEIKNYGIIDPSNKKTIFDIYNEEVISKNNSIISKLFYATNCNTTRCSKCNKQIYNFQTYFFIVFPLEEVRKFKNDLINQQNQILQNNIMNNFQNQFNSFNYSPQFPNNNIIVQPYQNYNYSYTMNQQNLNINNIAANQQYQNNNNNMNQPYQNYNYSYTMNQPNLNTNNITMNQQNFNNINITMNQQYQNNNNNLNQPYQAYNYNYAMNQQNFNINNIIMNQQNQINNNINQNYQNNNIINNNDKNEVCLIDCFDYDRKPNIMKGQNAMFCNGCKSVCDCIVWTNLVTGPEILILLLNRGNGKEFDIKIIFDENLDLTKYIENGCKYKLMGVISHLGENGMEGHFIAYCKDPITKKWYKYNDSLVNEVEDFKKEVIDFAMPYLLFYEKINNE